MEFDRDLKPHQRSERTQDELDYVRRLVGELEQACAPEPERFWERPEKEYAIRPRRAMRDDELLAAYRKLGREGAIRAHMIRDKITREAKEFYPEQLPLDIFEQPSD